jgi:hypothetical protein
VTLIEEKTGPAYDKAVELLLKLRDLADYQGRMVEFHAGDRPAAALREAVGIAEAPAAGRIDLRERRTWLSPGGAGSPWIR